MLVIFEAFSKWDFVYGFKKIYQCCTYMDIKAHCKEKKNNENDE